MRFDKTQYPDIGRFIVPDDSYSDHIMILKMSPEECQIISAGHTLAMHRAKYPVTRTGCEKSLHCTSTLRAKQSIGSIDFDQSQSILSNTS